MAKKVQTLLERVKDSGTKFIVVTGGVCSSLGKGVLISSIGTLLKKSDFSVSVVKWDPYYNVDPGTMSPLVHGEVFVTDDGVETDLDLGHYERFLGLNLDRTSSVSSGQIYKEILDGERDGKYLGNNIQFVPHVVDAIKNRLLNFALKKNVDFVLLEIGGTIGDMEALAFLEAIRQLKMDLNDRQLMLIHLSYVPFLNWANELKTKPTQHSVMLLKKYGLIPDSLVLRLDGKRIDEGSKRKLSVMCGIEQDMIFESLSFYPIYKLFLDIQKQGINKKIQQWFKIKKIKEADLSDWKKLIKLIDNEKADITIGLVAKYVGSNDPYLSVIKALESALFWRGYGLNLVIIDAEKLAKEGLVKGGKEFEKLKSVSGIMVPGGFDKRGVDGKILAAKYAREKNIPYLGLCLGLQTMLIEFARSVLKLKDASSVEFDKNTSNPIITILEEQKGIKKKGGTMRLGAYPCSIVKGTKAAKAYGKNEVKERHRHRYEFNNDYRKAFEKKGVVFSGFFKDLDLVEIAELKNHPFMVGVQFHPEFLSSPLKPHPLFKSFISAVIKKN